MNIRFSPIKIQMFKKTDGKHEVYKPTWTKILARSVSRKKRRSRIFEAAVLLLHSRGEGPLIGGPVPALWWEVKMEVLL